MEPTSKTETRADKVLMDDLIAYRIAKNRQRIKDHLHVGNIEQASYYADRVLCLVGKGTDGTR